MGEERDDIGIAECQPTGGDTVVSSAAEGVAVHRPQEDWPADLEGQASRLPEVGLPRDCLPLEFIGMGLDGGDDVAERGRFGGRQGSCLRSDFEEHDSRSAPDQSGGHSRDPSEGPIAVNPATNFADRFGTPGGPRLQSAG